MKNGHSEDKEGDWRIILRCILGKEVIKMEGGWNWLRIMSNGWLGRDEPSCSINTVFISFRVGGESLYSSIKYLLP
jgi:hypothetical protein